MIPTKIFEIGAMLGLENKDIRDLVLDISDESNKLEVSMSPIDTYKGSLYGTVSLKDFQ